MVSTDVQQTDKINKATMLSHPPYAQLSLYSFVGRTLITASIHKQCIGQGQVGIKQQCVSEVVSNSLQQQVNTTITLDSKL